MIFVTTINKCALSFVALGGSLLLASCGGSAASPTQAPGTADLHGQLVQAGGRSVSAASDGLSGVAVSLLDGQQSAGTDTTDEDGRFEFNDVPSGREYT
ncbi:MAG: carboxypeptidase-like regulatory domain-containing protein, partial [bacterium]|nr:carboxypeptidase-like regulatory domain-containing protein [bacterium]